MGISRKTRKKLNSLVESHIVSNIEDILEIIDLVESGRVTLNYLEEFDYQGLSLDDAILEAISNGDYISAYNFLKDYDVTDDIEFSLYKEYLTKLMDSSKKVNLKNSSKDAYAQIKIEMGNKDYNQAFNEYLESDLEDVELGVNLVTLKVAMIHEAEAYESLYKAALTSHDYKRAYTCLEEYKNFITGTSIDRELDYHFKRIEVAEKEEKDSNYELKMTYYSLAKKLFLDNGNLEEALASVNKYIMLDHNTSFRGYLLRGRIFASLGDKDQALDDYNSALRISPEPNVLYEIARYYYYKKDYENALKYLKDFECRRPKRYATVMNMLANCYKHMGDNDKSIEYKTDFKRLKYTGSRKVS